MNNEALSCPINAKCPTCNKVVCSDIAKRQECINELQESITFLSKYLSDMNFYVIDSYNEIKKMDGDLNINE